MSPAVTRATTATATPLSPAAQLQQHLLRADFTLEDRSPSPSSSNGEQSAEDRRSSTSSAREPFVPKRKPTKPFPYTYLIAEASTSAESLPTLETSSKASPPVISGNRPSVPVRPASALDTPLRASPVSSSPQKSARQLPAQTAQTPLHRSARTTRSTSRNLNPLVIDSAQNSAEPSTRTTPLLQSRSVFIAAPSSRDPQHHARPRSHTPTSMAARTVAAATTPAPSTPKIKAAVSADVAARIRSPKKHASTSALRASALNAATRSAHPLQQSSRDMERSTEAYAQSSSTWQQDSEGNAEGEPAGESSFVYDAGGDTAQSHAEGSGHDTVQVHVRLRPPKRGEECAWVANPYSGTVALEASIASGRTQSANHGPFTFDGIQTGSANRPVYISVARPLVRAALDGYDAVVFAYGQTASGKTFTLSGDEKGQEAGIIPRAVRDIFRGIKQSSARREYLLRASYLEIWNEVVKDLLEPSNVPQVRDDKRRRGGKGTTVQPLREEIVTSPAQVRELLARGQANRHVGATDWNERSSRSHTCFKITIESWERDHLDGGSAESKLGKKVTVSELCLIDLAGSEKYVSQGSDRRAEGAHINKSLLTLGKVIYALSDKTANPNSSSVHIPYRDSKLTRILQNSLSGHARVAVVCTINPNPSAVDESLSTLNFAKRIKKVGLNARRNEVDGSMGGLGAEAQALILRYQTEADALRKMVQELQKQGPHQVMQEQVANVDDERIRELQERLDVIGSLVVRGGRAYEGDSAELGGADSGDEEMEGGDAGQRQSSGSGSTISSSPFDSNSTPTTSRSTSHSSTSAFARPVSPTKPSSTLIASHMFGFDDPPHLLAEKLFLANRRIASLAQELSLRPPAPSNSTSPAAIIAAQAQQIRELEAVVEAQAGDAPPKIREDVEREFEGKLKEVEKRVEEKDSFIAELQAEVGRLRRVNARLMELAHQQTQDMVENLASPSRRPPLPLKNSDAANTPRRRLVGEGGSPFKTARPRPMSLFNPTFSTTAQPEKGVEEGEGARKGSSGGAANKRRSISNDYTLLKLGTQEIEEEITLRSAGISASETFANLGSLNLAAAAAPAVDSIAE